MQIWQCRVFIVIRLLMFIFPLKREAELGKRSLKVVTRITYT